MTALLSYLLITFKTIELEKVSLRGMQTLRTFVNTLSADDKYSLLNNDTLTQPIHMQLSQKQKTFCQNFSAFLKSRLNFPYFRKKKDEPHS